MKKSSVLAVAALAAVACGGKPSGNVRASLTDAPLNVANVAHFNVTISEVRVKNDDEESENQHEGEQQDPKAAAPDHHDADLDGSRGRGWVVLCRTPQIYDLMTLRNGTFAPLCGGKLTTTTAGHLSKIWLDVTAAQLVFTDGTVKDLTVPRGPGAGFVIDVDDLLEKDKDGEVKVDFLAGESVEDNGNGTYTLHARLREIRH